MKITLKSTHINERDALPIVGKFVVNESLLIPEGQGAILLQPKTHDVQ